MKDRYTAPQIIPKVAYEDYSDSAKGDEAFSGETVVVGDGEYLQIERSEKSTSVSWTSTIGIRELIEYAEKTTLLTLADEGEKSFIQVENGRGVEVAEGTAGEIVDFLISEDVSASYVRIEYDKLALIWSAPAARIKDSNQVFAEVAIVTRDRNQELVESIIKDVGSRSIQEYYPELVGRLKEPL